ncbi:MAG TPA: pyridoxal 5'-phosphate synthase glutaminase subunit PdxT [Candidatus Marinimicrobia bacterium]|nr:pyridoxal 5'-phosphate synthase glutaminase subunit PdxT [Candidatus Neomarinimicrobiota bacterium]
MKHELTIGVLGLQGAFAKHMVMLSKLDVSTMLIRYPEELDQCDGLIIPGGESTTMSILIHEMKIRDKLLEYNRPIFGTCAGAILMAAGSNDPRVTTLNRVPVRATRNAWGRQVESFLAPVNLSFDEKPFNAVFIRAPKLVNPRPEVQILGRLENETVLVQHDNVILATFHPELTDDTRIHTYFLKLIKN